MSPCFGQEVNQYVHPTMGLVNWLMKWILQMIGAHPLTHSPSHSLTHSLTLTHRLVVACKRIIHN
jgi:hypothetical protein